MPTRRFRVPRCWWRVRGVGTDTLLITFSAETQITGGDANDWMGLEVHKDGVPINPFTAGSRQGGAHR